MGRVDGDLDPEGTAAVVTALRACIASAARTGDDVRSAGQRRADAIVEICRFYLDDANTARSGGDKPHVTAMIDLDALQGRGGGTCELDGAGVGHPETARRIACDAGISRVITWGPSEPLDVGRRIRSVPSSIRRALAVRDAGCAVAVCDRPPGWCDAHHIRHWADGEDTSMDNLVLLCRRHHRMVHEGRMALPP